MPEYGYCKECKWWVDFIYRDWDMPKAWMYCNREQHVESKASVIGDVDGGSQSLATAPDFGCVQFETINQ